MFWRPCGSVGSRFARDVARCAGSVVVSDSDARRILHPAPNAFHAPGPSRLRASPGRARAHPGAGLRRDTAAPDPRIPCTVRDRRQVHRAPPRAPSRCSIRSRLRRDQAPRPSVHSCTGRTPREAQDRSPSGPVTENQPRFSRTMGGSTTQSVVSCARQRPRYDNPSATGASNAPARRPRQPSSRRPP